MGEETHLKLTRPDERLAAIWAHVATSACSNLPACSSSCSRAAWGSMDLVAAPVLAIDTDRTIRLSLKRIETASRTHRKDLVLDMLTRSGSLMHMNMSVGMSMSCSRCRMGGWVRWHRRRAVLAWRGRAARFLHLLTVLRVLRRVLIGWVYMLRIAR